MTVNAIISRAYLSVIGRRLQLATAAQIAASARQVVAVSNPPLPSVGFVAQPTATRERAVSGDVEG